MVIMDYTKRDFQGCYDKNNVPRANLNEATVNSFLNSDDDSDEEDDSDNYKNDKEVPKRIWKTHLNRYKKKYRIKKDELGVSYIHSKLGQIKPHSIVKRHLCAYLYFGTRKRNSLLSKLPSYCKVLRDGDDGVSIWFPEYKLDELAKIFEVYKKKKLSEENLAQLRLRIAEINASRGIYNDK